LSDVAVDFVLLQLPKFDFRNFDGRQHPPCVRTEYGERRHELEGTAGKLAEELRGFIVASRLLKNLSIFRYHSVSRDYDRVLNSACNFPCLRLGEFFRQRSRISVSDRLFVDRAWTYFINNPKDVQRPPSRLRFRCQNNSHWMSSFALLQVAEQPEVSSGVSLRRLHKYVAINSPLGASIGIDFLHSSLSSEKNCKALNSGLDMTWKLTVKGNTLL